MTVPNCSKHNSAMRAGKYPGTWFCPRVVGQDEEGKNIYCSERVKGQIQPNPDPVRFQKAQEGPQDAPGTTNEWGLALRFAGEVYRGTGKASEALELAAAARALLP